MGQHARRTPVPVALWALLVLLAGAVCGTATGPAGGVAAALPAAALPAAAPVTGSGEQIRPAVHAPGPRPAAADDARAAHGLHASAAVQHTRLPGLPGGVPGPVAGPLAVPLPPGEIAGPRRERAPPATAPSSRSTRGPPSTRSS
ncbi:hypothetical protein ACSNOH_20900 [Streptomyces sp. URMC 127]|uniref:hypothetical protein n=1 Tax=Streptomyces sp. URMC 127 TaxID=3423402 RepID=UPI003F1CB7F5